MTDDPPARLASARSSNVLMPERKQGVAHRNLLAQEFDDEDADLTVDSGRAHGKQAFAEPAPINNAPRRTFGAAGPPASQTSAQPSILVGHETCIVVGSRGRPCLHYVDAGRATLWIVGGGE